MDRRHFLASSGAMALAFAADPGFAKGKAASGDTRLHVLLDAVFQDGISRSPEFATSLGVDKGKLAPLRAQLSPATAAERHRDLARNRAWHAKLKAIQENSAAVEEALYAAMQAAMFQLQDETQRKLNVLLSEELELRRQERRLEQEQALRRQERRLQRQ